MLDSQTSGAPNTNNWQPQGQNQPGHMAPHMQQAPAAPKLRRATSSTCTNIQRATNGFR